MASRLLWPLAALTALVQADGTGILGAGRWLYKPICAHTCRYVLRMQHLQCEPPSNVTNPYEPADAHDPVCFLLDAAFLKTTALCVEEYCARQDDEEVLVSTIEQWWEGHLATGTLGDWSEEMRPVVTYTEALRLAKMDQDEGELPEIVEMEWMNETSWVPEELWRSWYDYQLGFQIGEFWHGYNSLIIAVTSVGLPIVLSLFRFIPGSSHFRSRLHAILDQPLFGHRHRAPLPYNIGLMPTRGQSIFIAYIVIVNVVLMCVPVHSYVPNARFTSAHVHRLQVLGDRAGVLAFALYIALYLFSARNNILLWVTDWSHSTFLLLHRWIAYMCIYQTVMHSILLLRYFVIRGTHDSESQLPYWYWGIIATLFTVLIWPLSILSIRRRMYEFFLATHQVLAALVLISSFLHIYYLYEYDWGYEIWIYAAGGIWFLERLIRIVRIAAIGKKTARAVVVEEGSDLLRLEIDDVVVEGHVYLFFPSLNWRLWESHPFSVLASFTSGSVPTLAPATSGANANGEKTTEVIGQTGKGTASSSDEDVSATHVSSESIRPRAVLLIRPQTGTTKQLLERTRAAGGSLSLPVLVEASYHSSPSLRSLSHCSTIIGIAGGVGITAIVPVVRSFGGSRARVFWGVKHDDISRAVAPEIRQLEASGVSVETTIGSRIDVSEVVREEVLGREDRGPLGIVVCGPPAMADDVRRAVGGVVGSGKAKREVIFVDETFSW